MSLDKKEKKFKVENFIEREAEEGSENEKNDDIIKNISDAEENGSDSEDGFLDDLIATKEDEKQVKRRIKKETKLLRNKFLEDELKKDEIEIKELVTSCIQIAKSYKKRTRQEAEINSEISESEFSIRPKEIKKISNISKYKKALQESLQQEEELLLFLEIKKLNQENLTDQEKEELRTKLSQREESEEINNIVNNFEYEIKAKISAESSEMKRKFSQRLEETEKMMKENIINLNSQNNNFQSQNLKTTFISKSKEKSSKMPIKNPFIHINKKNSLLNAIKNDKYYVKPRAEDKNLSNISENERINKLFPIFHKQDTSLEGISEKKKKISTLFTAKGGIKLKDILG
jgi:hypothetical protein